MERSRVKVLTEKQRDLILALHKSELTSRQIAEVAKCAQSTVIRHLQKFQQTGHLPITKRRESTRRPAMLNQIVDGYSPQQMSLTVNYQIADNSSCGMREIFHLKSPINEQLNLNRNQFAHFSISNMMEVKHSPATQMEFRSTTNGLPDEEEEDLDTLYDDGDGKSLTPPSDDDDTKAPILNGISKHSDVLTSSEILDDMEIDLIKKVVDSNEKAVEVENADVKKENEEAEGVANADSDMLEVDLEKESPVSKENGEITDASNVRDTGDDLDTLLSKINDLVEDCMEPKVDGAPISEVINKKQTVDDIVEILDDDADDMTEASTVEDKAETKLEIKTKDSAESKLDEDVKSEATPKAINEVAEEASKKPVSVSVSVEPPPEKMDIDNEIVEDCDDVVCLDSPLHDEDKEDDDEILINEALKNISESAEAEQVKKTEADDAALQADKELVKKEEALGKTDEKAEKPAGEAKVQDDEVYLIDDDDDDEPMKEAESLAKTEDKMEESKEAQLEREKELEKEIEKELEEMIKPEEEEKTQKTEVISEEKPPINNGEDDDDDIVCLDDSFEETGEKSNAAKEDTSEKVEDVEKEEKDAEKCPVKDSEKEPGQVSEKIAEEVIPIVTEKIDKEPEKEEEVEKEVVEEVGEKVVGVPEQVVEEEAKTESKDIALDDKNASSIPEKSSKDIPGDDIIILDDDDEEDETAEKGEEKSSTGDSLKKSPTSSAEEDKKTEEKSSSPKETTVVKPSTILSDNSDNARDGVEEKEENNEAKASEEKTPVPSESNSCSNSSNLLKETATVEREENSEQPPAKRIRLSQDEINSRHSTVSQEDTKSNTVDEDETMEVKARDDEENKSLKRVHSTESVLSDFKKPKTDEEPVKVVEVEPQVVKKQVEVKPLALYPPPKLEAPTIDLSLDFLRRFKKSVHKMTKSDLEELVLQKIVEAIVHKSEFSEMRDLIEKQEKIISGHRTKITELNKQFRDLEMVHNRVLKDLETKNSQFIMPVKITRAVGLQVFFPNKKSDQPLVPPSQMQTSPAPISRSVSNLSSNSERSSLSNAPTTSSNATKSIAPNSTQPTVVNNAQQQPPVQRRGCVQKLTPMRPDTPRNSPLNRSVSQGAVSSSTPSPVLVKEAAPSAKILSRTTAQKTRLNLPPMPGNIAPSTPSPLAVQQAEKVKSMVAPPGIASKSTPVSKNVERPPKRVPKACQSDPQTISQPLPPAATILQPHIPPSMTANLTVTPKPPSKSVIDLTDEDDVAPASVTPATNSPRTPAPATITPATPVARATPSPSATPTANRGPYKVSVIPQQHLQQPKPNPPKQTPHRPVVPIAPKPNGVAVSVRQVPANPSRYRHPAPLPNQPIHSSNPEWKLPPARPTIRISNLESGIVISWTIEDTTKNKYADSTSYQIYAYQETSGPPLVESWRHVGDVKAMLLPMAVTLTQFQEGQRYYFAVRAVDAHNRCGPFSFAKTWS